LSVFLAQVVKAALIFGVDLIKRVQRVVRVLEELHSRL
jgi:hypothetical protein